MTWRVFWFLIKLGVVGALAAYFTIEPGRVTIDWLGFEVVMPVGIMALALFIAFFIVAYWERIRMAVFKFPSRWRAQRQAIREMKGYRALTLGMVAVAAGDAHESRRQSRRAKDLLTEAPLTKLLQAQTARLSGDEQAATKYFEDMRGDPEVAFLGIRGLMTQALKAGDSGRAMELAEEARRLRPTAKWVLLELLDLQMEAGRWKRALATLDDAERSGAMKAEEADPIRSQLAVKQANRLAEGGEKSPALKLAQSAMKADPDNTEAITLTAGLLKEAGKLRKAEKMVEDAWKALPDPALARVYRTLVEDGTTELAQVKRFEKLLSLAPESPESHIALADVSLDAALWGEARTHLAKATDILDDPPPARLCRLWARLEESEHNNLTASHAWLLRATEQEAGEASDNTVPALPAHRDETMPV